METTIKYIPFADKGPHYVETGARPEYRGATMPLVNVQLLSGAVCSLHYKFSDDTFVEGHDQSVAYSVICWWHLPDAVPNLEREWFDAAGPSKGYTTDRWRVEQEWQYRAEFMRPDDACPVWYGEFRETLDEAVADAYNHWVSAGRP